MSVGTGWIDPDRHRPSGRGPHLGDERNQVIKIPHWQRCSPGCPGWVIDSDTLQVQRCDDCSRFSSDTEAAIFVQSAAPHLRETKAAWDAFVKARDLIGSTWFLDESQREQLERDNDA